IHRLRFCQLRPAENTSPKIPAPPRESAAKSAVGLCEPGNTGGAAWPKVAPPAERKFVATLIVPFTGRPFLGVSDLGLKEQPELGAALLHVSATDSANPGLGVTVTVYVTSVPAVVVIVFGDPVTV